MKRTLLALISIFTLSTSVFSSNESTIKDVTVYKQYAKITRTTSFTVSPGNSEATLSNLSTNIIPSSLQAKIEGGATLLSLNYQVNYLENKGSNARIKELQDSVKLLNNEIIWIQNQKAIYQGEEQLINVNNKLGSTEQGMTVEQLQALAKFYRERILDIRKKSFDLTKEENDLIFKKNQIQRYLNQLNSSNTNKPTGEVVLNLSANVSTKITVTFSYLVSGAGWTPLYDIKYESIDKGMNLKYKANVYQNTGYDWKDIQLSISNGNPAQNNDRPILHPLYVNFYSPPVAIQKVRSGAVKNMAYAESLPESDDLADYETEKISAPAYIVDVNENQITSEYAIQNKQSVASDGKYHLVALDDIKLDAKYQYHSVPRLDKGAFLLAKIYDYGKYNLSTGMANVFFEGMYIGQTQINPHVSSDTLLISLGRDNGINVQRTQLNDLTSTKLIGSNKTQSYAYEIIVKNNKSKAITIDLLDAIPISQNSDIEVELIESSEAEYSKEYGKLSWMIHLAPGQSKNIRFTYSIKYPKNQSIQVY